MDQQDFFQMEFFQYRAPQPRPQPQEWRRCDIGYSTVGVHVADLDAVLGSLAGLGTAPLTEPIGPAGARRVCVVDPDGVLVELMEDDPRTPRPIGRLRPEIRAAVRSVTLSVPDLARSHRFFVDALGFAVADPATLHRPEHEGFVGPARRAPQCRGCLEGRFLVELVQYTDPVGRPRRDDHRLSDLGLLNIVVGARTLDGYRATRDTVVAVGLQTFTEAALEFQAVTYVADDQDFSVELIYIGAELDHSMGLVPEGQPA